MKRKGESRSQRVDRLAKMYTRRYERMLARAEENKGDGKKRSGMQVKKPLKKKVTNARVKPMICYDLETTRIAEGTPKPLYLTYYGVMTDGTIVQGSIAIQSIEHLAEVIVQRLLIPELSGYRFVAWNGNKFDVYLVAAGLLSVPGYVMRPYLTRSKNLRGLRVVKEAREDESSLQKETSIEKRKRLSWEFLDGMAMTGANAWPDGRLKFFLERYAPEYHKLEAPDWENEEFDSLNPEHVRYAERDSEGLYHAMQRAQGIVLDTFGVPLYPTIGNTGIRIFQRNIPDSVTIWEPPYSALQIIRDYVMRGGYCFCVRRYQGPVWKYDINQAYAAAMRDTWLPSGRCAHTDRVNRFANAAIYRVSAVNGKNRVPFYYRDTEKHSVYGMTELPDTWVTNEELEQLTREKWSVKVHEGWFWDEVFNMRDYVNRLEKLRGEAEGGPNGAIGLMVKAIGNNSYGKTVERLEGLELVLSKDCPEGFFAYQDEDDLFRHVWAKLSLPVPREYHQPQLGAFITAHVRMVVRRAALLNPHAWLYTDTDGCMFSEPIDGLNLDTKRYGFWKLECANEQYRIINKKTYAKIGIKPGDKDKHAKGLNVKFLTDSDFERWFNGEPPRQKQLQRQNFIKVMTGFEMFAIREKTGEKISRVDSIR